MSDSQITIGKYSGVQVGQGGFATVFRVVDSSGNTFALKLADAAADEAIRASLYHEFTVQSELIHPQIVRAHDFGVFEGRPYIVLDWVEGDSFFDYNAPATSDNFTVLLRQLARGLYFMHHRNWVHGDLKPDNLLWGRVVDQGGEAILRILDFGLARPVGDADRPRGAGTIGYCAPEFLNNLPADGRADWYSAGIILYEWIYGVRPYAAEEPAIEIAGHLEGTPSFDLPQVRSAPEWANELIARLLAKSAEERADDEPSLLSFMSEFDPGLEPAALLNDQLIWHARSEARHLRANERELLAALQDDLSSGLPALWAVRTHGTASTAWLERAAGFCAHMGYDVSLLSPSTGCTILSDNEGTPRLDESRIGIQWYESPTVDSHSPGAECFRSLTLLQWSREEVRDYVRGVVGDDDVAEAWTDSIHHATCGLPHAVRDVIEHLIDTCSLSIDPDGWALDESAVESWMAANVDDCLAQTLGPLDAAERNLCEWLALAEGFASRPILNKVWQESLPDIDTTLHTLAARSVIVGPVDSYAHELEIRLRLVGHDAVLRASMNATEVRNRSELLANALASSSVGPPERRATVLAHAYYRAEMWDKASEKCLNTATFAIENDDRERAMRYIHLAQESAKGLSDETSRRHWLGHARMVEGDLQKAAGQLDAARRIYRELLALCRKSGDRRLLAETLHDLADLYHITQRYGKGICAERQALRIWQTLGDRSELSRSLNSLGNLHRIAGDYPRALEFYTQAIEIQRELGLEKLAAINLNNIGIIYWLQYDFDAADRYFQEALAIHERLKVSVEIARVLNNLGAIGFVQGKLPESQDYFLRAAQLNADSEARSEELFNRWNLVEVALEAGDLRTAVGSGEKVFRACMEIGEHATAAEVGALLADAYARVGDDRRAISFYQECRRLSSTLKNDDLRLHLDLNSVSRHFRFGRYDDADAILDAISPVTPPLSNQYRYLDTLVLRAQLASVRDDASALHEIWEYGARTADAIRAPHKRAQLSAVCSSACIEEPWRERLESEVMSFLLERPRWLWASAFHLGLARREILAKQFDAALERVDSIISQARADGHGDLLWRALVLAGEIHHALADYEPSMRALDEATRVLKFVASTVDDEEERAVYLACDEARTLRRIQERITQLVS